MGMILSFSPSLSVTWADADLIVCNTKLGSEAWQSVCPLWAYSEEYDLTRWTFVGKVMSLLFNVLPRLIVTYVPRRKHLLISWLQ